MDLEVTKFGISLPQSYGQIKMIISTKGKDLPEVVQHHFLLPGHSLFHHIVLLFHLIMVKTFVLVLKRAPFKLASGWE